VDETFDLHPGGFGYRGDLAMQLMARTALWNPMFSSCLTPAVLWMVICVEA
jgi:hypothetical protein